MNLIKELKTALILLRSNISGKNKEIALSGVENAFNILEAAKDEILLYDFLFVSLSEIKSLVQDENFSQAYDLVDCIHVIPDIVESPRRNWKEYWKIYVENYVNDWGSSSLLQFKKEILALDKTNGSCCRRAN